MWIGLDDRLVSLDKKDKLQQVPLQSLGIQNDTIRQVISSKGAFILNSMEGNIYACANMSSICQKTNNEPEEKSYNTLVAIPNDTYVVVNNFSASIISYDFKKGTRITNENYNIPKSSDFDQNAMVAEISKLDGFNPTRLYRPNSGYVIDNKYIQSDTGNFRVIAWPLVDSKPDFKKPILLTDTEKQPYNVGFIKGVGVKAVDALVVLEGPPILLNGDLVSYKLDEAGSKPTKISLPIKDPTLMAQGDDNTFYVMEAKTGQMVTVKLLSATLPAIVSEFNHPELNNLLQQNFVVKSRYELFSKLVWGLFLLPVIMLILLVYMGYNLNQKL